MSEYHKIDSVFKRDPETKFKTFLYGEYSRPEFKALRNISWEGTEKIDGCVRGDTNITMSDGTTKRIRNIQEGELVLGVDEAGSLVPTPVLRKWKNGLTDDWLKVSGQRRGVGRGSSFFAVHCTPDHQFFNPERGEYVRADELTPGVSVMVLRSEMGLTPLQRAVMIGKMLGPYIPSVMQRKLPERYRGGEGWLPRQEAQYKPKMVQLVVDSIEPQAPRRGVSSQRHDLATGTQNYFANGVLVHNCNIRIYKDSLMPMDLTIRGRTDKADIPKPLFEVLRGIEELLFETELPDETVLYGEGYGAGIQSGGSYRPDQAFVLFDVLIGNRWQPRENVEAIAHALDIPVVPIIHSLTLPEWVEAIEDGFFKDSILHPGAENEGVVIRPEIELQDRHGERVITKLKYKDFQ